MAKIRVAQSGTAVAPLPGKIRKLSPTARHCALWALLLVDSGMTAQQALATAFSSASSVACSAESSGLAPVERNLCSELVYGYLRTELRIAFILSRVLPRPQSLPRPLLQMDGGIMPFSCLVIHPVLSRRVERACSGVGDSALFPLRRHQPGKILLQKIAQIMG